MKKKPAKLKPLEIFNALKELNQLYGKGDVIGWNHKVGVAVLSMPTSQQGRFKTTIRFRIEGRTIHFRGRQKTM